MFGIYYACLTPTVEALIIEPGFMPFGFPLLVNEKFGFSFYLGRGKGVVFLLCF